MTNERLSNILGNNIELLLLKCKTTTLAYLSKVTLHLKFLVYKFKHLTDKVYTFWRTVLLIILLALTTVNLSVNAANSFEQRYSTSTKKTRIVFEFTEKVKFSSQAPSDSSEMVLTIVNPSDIEQLTNNNNLELSSSHIKTVEYRHSDESNNLQIVLNLKNNPNLKVFDILPSTNSGHRVIVDLFTSDKPVNTSILDNQKSTPNDLVQSKKASEAVLSNTDEAILSNTDEAVLSNTVEAVLLTSGKAVLSNTSVAVFSNAGEAALSTSGKAAFSNTSHPALSKMSEPEVKPIVSKNIKVRKGSQKIVPKPIINSNNGIALSAGKFSVSEHTEKKNFVVVIDPGHGGVDLGSISPNNTFEKDLTLSIANHLKRQLNTLKNVRATLTRSKDIFVYPHERSEMAEKLGADMLISLHADGHDSDGAQKISVWSYQNAVASSSLGQFLIQAESEAILLGNVADLLNNVPQENTAIERNIGLVEGNKIARSQKLASILSTNLSSKFKQYATAPQQANFVILAGRNIPSVVVNFGYLFDKNFVSNNKTTEQDNEIYKVKTKLFDAVVATISEYSLIKEKGFYKGENLLQTSQKDAVATTNQHKDSFVNEPLLSANKFRNESSVDDGFQTHKVGEGESLYQISRKYNTSVAILKQKNKLQSNSIQIGQLVLVPAPK